MYMSNTKCQRNGEMVLFESQKIEHCLVFKMLSLHHGNMCGYTSCGRITKDFFMLCSESQWVRFYLQTLYQKSRQRFRGAEKIQQTKQQRKANK